MPEPVPADTRFEALVKDRFTAIMERQPVYATYLGLHEHDHELADGSRDAILQDIADARDFLGQIEAIEPESLTPPNRVERELAIFTTRRQLFDDETHRVWERRVSASDEIGDGIFLLVARGTRPIEERLDAVAARLEASPRVLQEQRSRLGDRPMRLWNELELQAVESLPALFEQVIAAARSQLPSGHPLLARLERAATGAEAGLDEYAGWIRDQLGRATDDFALGSDRYDELIGLRAFDGLTADEILEVGWQQLAHNRERRLATAREIDGGPSEQEVIDRVKSDHPADFAAALSLYQRAMQESRRYIADHDIVTIPAGESLSVIATPEYLRKVMPFAAYFGPAHFEPEAGGIYVVTPSVDGNGRAMREHNRASIYNTSIHEAYPGHHLQLSAALANPSLVRLLVDAPEFVEGWAMYCEQMMREEGFDVAAEHRLMMYTDAIWRACRIILDIRLHRGQLSVEEATDFLVEQTGFERPNAQAEVHRYTYTPTYQLSYLLGKVLLLRLREDERRRLGDRFSLKAFHDAMLRQGSLPISFQRRLLASAEA